MERSSEEIWQNITLRIDIARTLWIVAVECASPEIERAFFLRLLVRCQQKGRRAVVQADASRAQETLTHELRSAQATPAREDANPKAVRAVRIPEPVSIVAEPEPGRASEQAVLQQINDDIDAMSDALKGAVLLVGGRDFLRRFSAAAPMLWATLKEQYLLSSLEPPRASDLGAVDPAAIAAVDAHTIANAGAGPAAEPRIADLPGLMTLLPEGAEGTAELLRMLHATLRAHVAKSGFHYQTNPVVVGAHGLAPIGSVPELERAAAFRFVDRSGAALPGTTQASKLRFPHPLGWILVAPAGIEGTPEPGPQATSEPTVVWGKDKLEAVLAEEPALQARYYPAETRRRAIRGFDGTPYDGFPYRDMDHLYRSRTALAFGSVRAPGDVQIPLKELFIPLRFARDDEREGPVSMGRMLEHRRSVFDTDPGKPKKPVHLGERKMIGLEDLLREKRSIIVLGDPGAGKTTLLKYLVLLHTGAATLPGYSPQQRLVPLYVSLRELADAQEQHPGMTIIDFLEMQARTEHGIARAHRLFFEAALRMGDAFVLLDGLDEVRQEEARRRIARQVRSFQLEYQDSRFWVTSRIQGYTVDFELPHDRFLHVRVGPLGQAQINDFVQRWCAVNEPDPGKCADLARSLQEAILRRPSVARLAASPLLLTLLAFIHGASGELSRHRGEIYDRCVEMLLATGRVSPRLQKDYLAHLAIAVQERDSESRTDDMRGLIDLADAVEILSHRHFAVATRERPTLSLAQAREEMRAFIAHITDGHGLLVDKGADQLAFIHPSFQEYLAAWVFTCDGVAWPEFFIERIGYAAWEEVLLLRLYLVLRTPGGDSTFEAIAEPLMRHMQERGMPLGWLTLLRALRDNLRFGSADRRTILEKALGYWVEDPRFPGVWADAFEEVCHFAEKARDDLRNVLAEETGKRGASEAVACLHLAAKLFGFPEAVVRRVRVHRDLREMLPDVVVFYAAAPIGGLLAEHASADEWTTALLALASPKLYRLTVGWMTSPPELASSAPLEAATRVLTKRITDDLAARTTFANLQKVKSSGTLLTEGGSVTVRGWKYEVSVPLAGARAHEESVPVAAPRRPSRGLLCLAFARERLEALETPAVERALMRWLEGLLDASMQRLPEPERVQPALVAALVRTLDAALFDFGSVFMRDIARDIARDFSGELVQQVVRAFGRDFVRVFGRDFVRAFGRDFVRAFTRQFAKDFVRDAVRKLARDHGAEAVRDFVKDLGVAADAPDFNEQLDLALEDRAKVDTLLSDHRFWNSMVHVSTPRFAADPAAPRKTVSLHFDNPFCIPMALFDLWNVMNGMHALSIGNRLVLRFPAGDPSRAAVEVALNEHPFDVFPVALAWEQHAESLVEAAVSLSGAQGALALTHAAYAALMTGITLDGPEFPTWQKLLAGRDKSDPRIEAAHHLYEICHFRDSPEHIAALRGLLATSTAPTEAPPPAPAIPSVDETAPSLAALLRTRN